MPRGELAKLQLLTRQVAELQCPPCLACEKHTLFGCANELVDAVSWPLVFTLSMIAFTVCSLSHKRTTDKDSWLQKVTVRSLKKQLGIAKDKEENDASSQVQNLAQDLLIPSGVGTKRKHLS